MYWKFKVSEDIIKDRNESNDVNVEKLKDIEVVECSIEGEFKAPVIRSAFHKKPNETIETKNVDTLIHFEQNVKRNNNNDHSSSESTAPINKK